MRTSVTIDLAGNLEAKAKRYSRAIHRMSRSSIRDMNMMHRSARKLGRGIDRMGNRYASMLAGGGLAVASKQVVDLQRRFTRLGIQSKKPVESMNALKKEIYDIAQAPAIRVDPSEITSAIESIVEKTGDLDFARDNIRNIGLAIQATGASGGAIGEILAEFQKMGITAPQEVLKALDTMNVQGKEGAFTLENLAALGPRVITAYTSMGRTGTQALKEMGAALQVIRMGTGSSEMAASSFEAVLRTLGNSSKAKLLQAGGIQVFDVKALKEGKEILRPINELMVEIIAKTKGKKTVLSQIFDAEAMRAFNAASSEFQRTGTIDSLKKFMKIQGDGTATTQDSARAANDAAGAMRNLYTAWSSFANAKLTEPIQKMADTLNALGSNNVMEALGEVALAGGAAYAGRKIYKGSRRGARALAREGSRAALKKTAAGALTRTAARGIGALGPVGAVAATGFTAYELGSAIEKALIGGRLGNWLYDITHSKVDVNLTLNQKGQAHVNGVSSSGIVGDTTIDNGLMTAGAG